jgi:carbon monoxide dehydrogenase subunit G
MEMQSTRVIAAPPEVVWRALNDPDALKECIPGCESLTRESDTQWNSVVTARVGPVSAFFKGSIELADVVPPSSYTIRFKGQGGSAGFANGEARVALAPAPGGQTTLAYTAKAQVGGRLAQIGSRLIDGAAAKLADEFFEKFAARFAPAAPATARAAEPHLPGWLIAAAVAAIVGTAWMLAKH